MSIDLIHGLSVEGRVLSGIAIVDYEGEEGSFSFDLDSREFLSGPDFSNWDSPTPKAKKAWWKFW